MTKFEMQCLQTTIDHELAVNFWPDESKASEYHDDGALHVVRRGVRAAFRLGTDDTSNREMNRLTRAILSDLKIPVTDRVLVEESGDEDDACSC